MSESAPQAPVQVVATVQDLLQLADLKRIYFLEQTCRRILEEREEGTHFNIEVAQRHGEEFFEIRFKLSVLSQHAEYFFDICSRYESEEPITFSAEVGTEFVERVGIMAVYPFFREALATGAARLEVEVPVLGLLKAGQFRMSEPSGELDPPTTAD